MKLIHCSDLHLDSKMNTRFSPEMGQQRNHEICLTFERMIHFANKNDINVILLCGDLFDTSRTRHTTVEYILDIIRRFPQIIFFYLRGNHDESSFICEKELPQNLILFSNQWQYFNCNDLVIAGIEIDDSNAENLYNNLNLDSNKTNVVMMHGQVGSESAVNMINLPLLKGKNIDYLALGHLHSYQQSRLDYRGVYCYSGCLEGRGFDETGEKGFVVLEIKQHSIQTKFIDFASRHFHKLDIDVSHCEKITDVLNTLRIICSEIPKDDLVQITLCGKNASGCVLDVSFLENTLSAMFYYIKVYDKTTFIDSPSSRIHNTLQKEFILSVQSDLTVSEEEKNAILQIGLRALQNKELSL